MASILVYGTITNKREGNAQNDFQNYAKLHIS